MAPNTKDIQIIEAKPEHCASLGTLEVRSYHPVNPFHVKVFPNTPQMHSWFSQIFIDEIQDSDCHPIIAVDSSAPEALQAIGTINIRLLNPEDKAAGFWSQDSYPSDCQKELFQPAIDAMVKYRHDLFTGTGKWHYLIELFGVDHAYKGTGVGKLLLQRACDVADEGGYDTFVEANDGARKFYEKFGFEWRDVIRIEMPDGIEDYVLHMLVRPAKKKG